MPHRLDGSTRRPDEDLTVKLDDRALRTGRGIKAAVLFEAGSLRAALMLTIDLGPVVAGKGSKPGNHCSDAN
jgi:hypothetical protein